VLACGMKTRPSPKASAAVGLAMIAYTVFCKENPEEAARCFEMHPHFSQFPGESVEVMACLLISENPNSRWRLKWNAAYLLRSTKPL
jgi:hypothetical protein